MSNPATNVSAPNSERLGANQGSFVGKRVGPYTICLELASGGMASVFLARAPSFAGGAQLVALKIIHRHLAERRDFVDMFVDEARISSLIQHRNVCQVYGSDKVDDTYYLAMEYLMGESLSAVFRRTSRRSADVARHAAMITRVAVDACAGLHAAHTLTDAKGKPLNVVHRDVSPENLFVTYSGVTKVVDFGLASAKHQTHRTRTGVIKGKFAYVCPEALDGARPGQRADIWGLGVVLWEALTGHRLFRGDSDMQTLAAVVDAPIRSPSSLRPGLPPALDRPVLRALSRNPAERQRSAEELAQELLEACPVAGRLSEDHVAEWMSGLFGNERRWKAQVTELVQAFSRPENAFDLEPDSAPTRVKTAPAWPLPAKPPQRPRRVWSGVVAAGSLLVAVALARLLPPVERAGAREPPTAVAAVTQAPPPAPAPPAAPAPAPGGAELRAKELPDGSGYLLEIIDSAARKQGLLLRIEPERPKPARRLPKAAAAAVAVAREPPDERSPPAWLRRAMEQERARDRLHPWLRSASRAQQASMNAPD